MKTTLISAVVASFASTMAMAQSATDQIINDLTGQGFQRIEIDNGIGQIQVEAIRGTQKLEVVYDRATGNILKQEVERVRSGEDTRPGVEIRNSDRDFVDSGRVSTSSSVGTTAMANLPTGITSTDQIVSDLRAQGFTRIEVKNGLSQTKVEAIRGTEKVETVFDRATGEVIKQEVETVRAGDDTRPGVEIRDRDRDFVDGSRSDDDDRRSGRDERDDDDDDDDRNDRDGGSDDDRGRGSDDDYDDDSRDDDDDDDHDDSDDDDDDKDDEDNDDDDDDDSDDDDD
jgi:uncharacterized protein Smg (DUF494 family)